MRKFLTKTVMSALALTVATQAMAEGRVCGPKVDWISMEPNGNVLVSFQGMGVANMCNMTGTINTNRGPVASDTCKGWYAGLTTVHAQNTSVALYFDFGTAAAPQCDAMGFNWSVPAAYPYLVAFY